MQDNKELQDLYVDRLLFQRLRFKYIFKHLEERHHAFSMVEAIINQLRAWPELEQHLRFIPQSLKDTDDLPQYLEVFLFNLEPEEFSPDKQALIRKLKKALFYTLPKLRIDPNKERENFDELHKQALRSAQVFNNQPLIQAAEQTADSLYHEVDNTLKSIEEFLSDKIPHQKGLIISAEDEFISQIHQYLNFYYLNFETARNLQDVKECLYTDDISFVIIQVNKIDAKAKNIIDFIVKSPFFHWLDLIAVVPDDINTKAMCYVQGIQHVVEANHLPELVIPLTQNLIQAQQRQRSHLKFDPHSRIPTYRNLLDYFEQAQAFAGRIGTPLSFAILELEHYYKILEEQGPYVIQTWLREFFQEFSHHFRRTDRIGLWRPNKFMVLLPNTPAQGAVFVIEKFLRAQKDHSFLDRQEDSQSFVAGIVQLQQEMNFEEAVYMGYEALEKAKRISVNNIYCAEHRLTLKAAPHILIVEDDTLVANIVSRCFEKVNYKVTHIPRGEDTLDYVAKQDISLVLLDLNLPGITGYEVLESIRSQRVYDELPVVILSSMNQEEDIIRCLELGANDFIAKPFSTPLILAKIARYFKP